MSEAKPYQYGFEIESILMQFVSMIDNAMVMRYEKQDQERVLVNTIKPRYIFSSKSRLLNMLVNNAKNFSLPCVSIQLNSISSEKERLEGKQTPFHRYYSGEVTTYDKPTPINLGVTVSIVTKYQQDLYQIYGKLCSMFRPYKVFSWKMPKFGCVNVEEELINKVEWDFNFNLEIKDTLNEGDEERFIGKMNFSIQGWIFPTHLHKFDLNQLILNIGTSEIISHELATRVENLDCPLLDIHKGDYLNPREFANSRIYILNAFVKNVEAKTYYRIHEINDYNIVDIKNKNYTITFDGYNFKNAKALFVPKYKYQTSQEKVKIQYKSDHPLWPKIGTDEEKSRTLEGYELPIEFQNDNKLTVKLEKINYGGEFDIVLYDSVDYDRLNRVILKPMVAS